MNRLTSNPAANPVPIAEADTLFLFEEQLPSDVLESNLQFKSDCPPDKKFKTENLFKFRRGRGDFHASVCAALLALLFLLFFWTQTGWENRKLPDNLGNYVGFQLGLVEAEGRMKRLGTILKQSWVVPMLCLLLLVPASLVNLYNSWKDRQWRKRFLLPVDASYESFRYLAALEYVAYFVAYTIGVPWIGYLFATVILGVYLTWRLGYRSPRWLLTGFISSVAVVVVFRTLLQIKTPVSIWLYDQLPAGLRTFMLIYF